MIKYNIPIKYKKVLKYFALCLIIEIFICNVNSFRLWGKGQYEKRVYTLDTNLEFKGAEITETGLICDTDEKNLTIILKGLDTCVGTVYIDLYSPQHEILYYELYYTDEATAYPIRNIEREYIEEVDRTKWITCYFAGNSQELRLEFPDIKAGEQLIINEIIINEPVPFHINIVRLGILFAIALLFFILPGTAFWLHPYQKLSQSIFLIGLTFCFLIITWNFYIKSQEEFHIAETEGDLYSQQLVDALLKKETCLSFKPSEQFMKLKNPYDITERSVAEMGRDIDYIWDAAYYNGNFYVYFGVVPAVLLFVPFKLVTGYYLSTAFAVTLFINVYLIFLNAILIFCIKNWLPEASFAVYPCSILTIDAASNALLIISSARFYELVYAAGLAFAAIGLYLLLSNGWKERDSYFRIFIGGLCLALTVGCRPPMLFYSFLLVPHLYKRLKHKTVKQNFLPFLILAIPYIIVAIGLMFYNYIRFDTILEFGQNYQITVTDIGKGSYFLSSLPWCLWRGMFQPLAVNAKFPFVHTGDSTIEFAGYMLNAEIILPMFSSIPLLYCMFCPSLWKEWKEKRQPYLTGLLITVIGLGWFIAGIVFVSAGVSDRYTVESIPLLTFGALLLYCNHVTNAKPVSVPKLLKIMTVTTLFSVTVAFLFGIVGEYDWIREQSPAFYYTIERFCCFWK